MKFFIINLEKDIEKKEKISSLCESLGLNYEIIKAVYGKELSKEDIEQNVADEKEQKKYRKRPLWVGEIGCALSHKKCLEKMLNDGLDDVVIFEDDAIFDERLVGFLKHKDKFPKDLELLLLGHHRQTYGDDGFRIKSPYSLRFDLQIENYHIKRLVGRGNGAYGYYITKNGAKRLLSHMQKIFLPFDLYTSNEKYINFYALFPTLVDFSIIDSSSTQKGFKVVKKSKFRKYIKLIKNKIQFFIPSLKPLKPYK